MSEYMTRDEYYARQWTQGSTMQPCGGHVSFEDNTIAVLDEANAILDNSPVRAQLLDEAKALTTGDRQDSYGEPVENMERIARLFNEMTGHNITGSDVAMLHVATKLARLRTSPDHRDSVVDLAAYAGIYRECVEAGE